MNVARLTIALIPYLSIDWDTCDLFPAMLPSTPLGAEIAALSTAEQVALVDALQVACEAGYNLRAKEGIEVSWCAKSQARHLVEFSAVGLPDVELTAESAAELLAATLELDDSGAGFHDLGDLAPSIAVGLFELINTLSPDEQLSLARSAVGIRSDGFLATDSYKESLAAVFYSHVVAAAQDFK